jgi:hypothetical protein
MWFALFCPMAGQVGRGGGGIQDSGGGDDDDRIAPNWRLDFKINIFISSILFLFFSFKPIVILLCVSSKISRPNLHSSQVCSVTISPVQLVIHSFPSCLTSFHSKIWLSVSSSSLGFCELITVVVIQRSVLPCQQNLTTEFFSWRRWWSKKCLHPLWITHSSSFYTFLKL